MPYFIRGSVDSNLRNYGTLSIEDSLFLGIKLSGALETAHALGILHRDVKPANILITDYGEPTLTDFGIAHIAEDYEIKSGIVTGSIAFIAPEVLGGMNPSAASDTYSLGATLLYTLTGNSSIKGSGDGGSTASYAESRPG